MYGFFVILCPCMALDWLSAKAPVASQVIKGIIALVSDSRRKPMVPLKHKTIEKSSN